MHWALEKKDPSETCLLGSSPPALALLEAVGPWVWSSRAQSGGAVCLPRPTQARGRRAPSLCVKVARRDFHSPQIA